MHLYTYSRILLLSFSVRSIFRVYECLCSKCFLSFLLFTSCVCCFSIEILATANSWIMCECARRSLCLNWYWLPSYFHIVWAFAWKKTRAIFFPWIVSFFLFHWNEFQEFHAFATSARPIIVFFVFQHRNSPIALKYLHMRKKITFFCGFGKKNYIRNVGE